MKFVMKADLKILALNDTILPPFTSKVTKTAFEAIYGYLPKFKNRTYRFSLLFKDGRALFRMLDDRNAKTPRLIAKKGDLMEASYSIIFEGRPELPEPFKRFKFSSSELEVRTENIEIEKLNSIRAKVGRIFRISFLSPALISVPQRGKYLKTSGIKRRYRLFPDIALILMLLSYDARINGLSLASSTPNEIFKWAYRAIAEVDYSTKPVTVLYDYKDIPVTERGFMGYAIYEILDDKYRDDVERLLGYASVFGIGKSRSIGFGHIDIRSIS